MEQLTPQEWIAAQVRRAPSFAVASLLTAVLLFTCALIEYAPAGEPPPDLPPVRADVEQEELKKLEEVHRNIDPERPEFERVEEVPEAPDTEAEVARDMDVEPVPAEGNFMEVETGWTPPTEPIPSPHLAAISIEPGSGSFRGELDEIRQPGSVRRRGRRAGLNNDDFRAILAGLRWLKNAQDKRTGGWDAQKWGANHRRRDAGVSGLALLAFLAYGCSDVPRGRMAEFAPTVRAAVTYLIEKQQGSPGEGNEGWFGEKMYSQAICAMALAEASAMLQNRILRRRARAAAQRGLDYIIRQQPGHGSFTYEGGGRPPRGGARSTCDVSVTGFVLQAFKAARTVGLRVPDEAIARCEEFLSKTLCKDGSSPYRIDPRRYQQRGSGKVSMTAASLTGRLFFGHNRRGDDCRRQAAFLTRDDRHIQEAKRANNLYTIYYMSLAMYNMGGRYWREWVQNFRRPLRRRQVEAGPNAGSWPTDGFRYGRHGGRVYTTAMACLALAPFKYLPSYRTFARF